MKALTDQDVIDAIEAVIAEKGADFVYSNPDPDAEVSPVAPAPAPQCRYVHGEGWSRRVLTTAQVHQDDGAPWGRAYKAGVVDANYNA